MNHYLNRRRWAISQLEQARHLQAEQILEPQKDISPELREVIEALGAKVKALEVKS